MRCGIKDEFLTIWSLTDEEVDWARRLTLARDEEDRKNGAFDRTNSPNPIGQCIASTCGELVFSKAFGLPVYGGVKTRKEDFTLPNGLTVDIKMTQTFGGNMNIPYYKDCNYLRCDIYVLMYTRGSRYFEFIGWLEAEKVYNRPISPGIRTDQFIVFPEELRDIRELKKVGWT